jgi:hypothetical protein
MVTKVREVATFLRWLTADGPIPVRAGLEAMTSNGYDATNRWRLNRAKQEAGVVSRRNGYGPGATFFWQLKIDRSPLPETPNVWGECNACGYTLWLPASTLPRPCASSPSCAGSYRPAPAMSPPVHVIEARDPSPIETRSRTALSGLSTWRSRPSPLRTRSAAHSPGTLGTQPGAPRRPAGASAPSRSVRKAPKSPG